MYKLTIVNGHVNDTFSQLEVQGGSFRYAPMLFVQLARFRLVQRRFTVGAVASLPSAALNVQTSTEKQSRLEVNVWDKF